MLSQRDFIEAVKYVDIAFRLFLASGERSENADYYKTFCLVCFFENFKGFDNIFIQCNFNLF